MFRVIETFSGIGAQAKALERLGIDFEVVNTVEWDVRAVLAYCMIHNGGIHTEKYEHVTDEEILEFLNGCTLSMDGKKPINETTRKRMPAEVNRMIYTAIKETRNLVSITDVHGQDIPDDIDLFTYSFPCQDLSLCGCWHGNKSGISREANNRSGMLWEVERILLEMHEQGRRLPRFLVMENVPNILSKRHECDFNAWQNTLGEMGYVNHIYRLSAKNFGIPQKRERAYMISVLCENDTARAWGIERDFESCNLQYEDTAAQFRQRQIQLSDILRLDYSREDYRREAEASTPNKTPSRMKIWEENDHLFDGEKINSIIVNAVTTKQDRNPNSGVIRYDSITEGKAPFRYLTPRECFMLMGFDEEDFQKVSEMNPALKQNRMLYSTDNLIKLAGNSIVVDVLVAVFGQIYQIYENNFAEK